MNVIGKVVKKMPIVSGITKAGKEWQKQDIIIDQTEAKYDGQLAITFFGDKIKSICDVQPGQDVDISFNATSNEYNGKFFTNLNGWLCSVKNIEINTLDNDADDLPF
jgi:hypothetical protein